MYELTGKAEWNWANRQDAAFQSLRQAALDNIVLASSDFKRQCIMASGASEDSKGWVIYQLKNPNGKDNLDNRDIIKHGFKA